MLPKERINTRKYKSQEDFLDKIAKLENIISGSLKNWYPVIMKEDFEIYNRIYAEYFKDNQPCRTTVEIISLPTPIAIELKCIAIV